MEDPTREPVMRLSSRVVTMLWQSVIEARAAVRQCSRDSRQREARRSQFASGLSRGFEECDVAL